MTSSLNTPRTPQLPAGGYRIDCARSTVAFRTRHLFGLGAVRGTFALRGGEIRLADPVQRSHVSAVISAASVQTGNAGRDTAVRSDRLLDADRHPDIAFTSTGLRPDGEGWVLDGRLTVRGETRDVPVRVEQAGTEGPRLLLTASARIDRYAFGVRRMRGLAGRRLRLELKIVADPA